MREIKFRYWDRVNKKMGRATPNFQINAAPLSVEFNNVTLLQYINLKDKTGKEIYEGDIVVSHRPDYNRRTARKPKVVEWKQSRILNGWSVAKGEAYEVIGNIYENPKLMERDNA